MEAVFPRDFAGTDPDHILQLPDTGITRNNQFPTRTRSEPRRTRPETTGFKTYTSGNNGKVQNILLKNRPIPIIYFLRISLGFLEDF